MGGRSALGQTLFSTQIRYFALDQSDPTTFCGTNKEHALNEGLTPTYSQGYPQKPSESAESREIFATPLCDQNSLMAAKTRLLTVVF